MTTEVISYDRVTWTNIVPPTEEDVRALGEAFPHFHPLDLEDLTSTIERPKIDEYEDYLFVVMQFPLWDPQRRLSRPSEVDLFIGSGYLVTAHDGRLDPLVSFFEACRDNPEMRARYMGQSAGYLFHAVIDRLVDYIIPILRKVDHNIREIEGELFTGDMRRVIREISEVRRDVIALRRIIRPQVNIIANLQDVERPFIREELEVFFDDIHDHIERARDIIDDDYEVIVGLADTSDSLASYRINEVMRILTVISVIMLPLTLIAGCYGMNVPLPGRDEPLSFFLIAGLMVLMTSGMLLYFRHRGWL
jgi:magnesium transporter